MPILFARSHFSMGESLLEPKQIAKAAKELGYSAACLCDTMTISGAPEFSKACEDEGIKPMLGCRVRIVDSLERDKKVNTAAWMMRVIVKTEAGFKQLLKLLTLANDEEHFYYVARVTVQDVLDTLSTDDVYVTTGDVFSAFHSSQVSEFSEEGKRALRSLKALAEVVPVNTPFWDKTNNLALRSITEWGLAGCIVTRSTIYEKDKAAALEVMGAISGRAKVTDGWHKKPYERDLHPISPAELVEQMKAMKQRLADRFRTDTGVWLRQAVRAHEILIAKTDWSWQKLEPSLPKMAEDENAEVRAACKMGWSERFTRRIFGHRPSQKDLKEIYLPRLQMELGVLERMGFAGYFLLVTDIVKWAKKQGIRVGPGRGSVGGSLVAYLMGITDVDPIRFGLIFERFINPDRIDLPDADLDFMSERRHEIIEYITEKYGQEFVAGISNYNGLASASALREVGRVHNLAQAELSVSKIIPKKHGKSLPLAEAHDEVADLRLWRENHEELWELALALEGKLRSMGQHAAGIVVAGEPVINRAVVESRKKDRVVNWDKDTSEQAGLVKLDVLGLSTLDTLALACDLIRKNHGKHIDLNALELDDEVVLEAFGEGETVGVFQFESGGMRKLLKDLGSYEKITFEDVVAATALYRPGPMDSGLLERYVNIKQGVEGEAYDHPLLEPALKETFGVLVYQEQVMRAARDLAGFTMAESDKLRKAMGKKLPEEMAKFRDQWVDGCKRVAEMDEEQAGELFDQIEKFAGYGFNKSHSVEYTLISYQSMWLKVYYPAEFYAAALTVITNSSKQDADAKLKSLVLDAHQRGIKVRVPDINISTDHFEIATATDLVMPLTAIKGVSMNTTRAVLKARESGPFTSVEDLEARVEKRKCNAKHRENMRRVGAFCRIAADEKPVDHEDRLKDQMELLPGLIIKLPKIKDVMRRDSAVMRKLNEVVQDYRDEMGTMMLPRPAIGKQPKFMVVTDAPTFAEIESNQISVGTTFAQISEALHKNKLSRQMAYFTTLIKEKKEGKFIEDDVKAIYTPYLDREVEILKPKVIVVLGSATARYFVKSMKGSILDNSGQVHFDAKRDASIVIGISPGMVYMDPDKQEQLDEVFKLVADMVLAEE